MRRQRTILDISLLAAALIACAGCGEILHPVPPPDLYVTSGIPAQVLAFSTVASGNPNPLNAITLPAGAMAGYIAGDPAGNLYIATNTDVREYAAGATGSATPVRLLPFDATTGIANITGFAVDAAGNLYISEFNHGIAVFASTANGSVAPTRTVLVGANSGMEFPEALATDRAGNLYVANFNRYGHGSIFVFGFAATGDTAPTRVLNVSTTGLATDPAGNLFATVAGGIQVFPPGASGTAAPLRTIQGTATGFARFTGGIAVDADANIYVVTWGSILYNQLPDNPTILEFAPTATGNASPMNTVTPAVWSPAIPVLAVH